MRYKESVNIFQVSVCPIPSPPVELQQRRPDSDLEEEDTILQSIIKKVATRIQREQNIKDLRFMGEEVTVLVSQSLLMLPRISIDRKDMIVY